MRKKKPVIKLKSVVPLYIEGLVAPYGGHIPGGDGRGVDCDGEYFAPDTNFYLDTIPNPPVLYAHGMAGTDKAGAAQNTVLGKIVDRWFTEEGLWAKMELDPTTPQIEEVMASYEKGDLKFSTAALLKSSTPDGLITDWLLGEVSVLPGGGKATACNLLTRATDGARIDEIVQRLPQEQQLKVNRLLSGDGKKADPTQSTFDKFPPEDESTERLGDFVEGEHEGVEDMKPEELALLMETAVNKVIEPLTNRISALEQPSDGNEGGKKPGTAKSDDAIGGTELLRQKADTMGVTAKRQGDITAFVDAAIASGRITPDNRQSWLNVITVISESKAKGASNTFADIVAIVEGLPTTAATVGGKLLGFGKSDTNDGNPEDVKAMAAAALKD